MKFENSLAFAQQLDNSFPSYRNEFVIPQHNRKDAIYFLGNSLGLRPKKTTACIDQIIQQWDALGVEAFIKGKEPWMEYHDSLIKPLSKIVGALPHVVVVMNCLTVN